MKQITNLSDAEFKILVIRMLKELSEYGNNIKEEMNVTLSEIKKNLQGTISGGEEAGMQMNDLEHKEEISIQPEQQEEKEFKKIKQGWYKDPLRLLQTYQHPNHRDTRRRGRARNCKLT